MVWLVRRLLGRYARTSKIGMNMYWTQYEIPEGKIVEWFLILIPVFGLMAAFICWAACYVGDDD